MRISPEYRAQYYFAQKDQAINDALEKKKRSKTDPIAAIVNGAENDPTPFGQMAGEIVKFLVGNNIPEAVVGTSLGIGVGRLAKLGIGRVATNVWYPRGYHLGEKFEDVTLKDALRAIRDDEALWSPANQGKRHLERQKEMGGVYNLLDKNDLYDDAGILRDTPYRMMFGLEPRYGTELYEHNPDGTIRFSHLGENVRRVTYPGVSDDMGFGNVTDNPLIEHIRWSGPSEYHPVMGQYNDKSIPLKDGDMISYHDVWDFGLNSGETIFNHPENSPATQAARYVMSLITDPVTIQGSFRK